MSDIKELVKQIEDLLKNSGDVSTVENTAIISSFADGVIEIANISGLKMGEILEVVETKSKAFVMYIDKQKALALVLDVNAKIEQGMYVKSTGKQMMVPVSDEMIGRVLDSMGIPIDGKSEIKAAKYNPLEKIAPGVITRENVDTPLQTGILAIDSLIPVGRGQRELIIGDRQTGKTSIAIDTIINQKGKDLICIYNSIAQKESNLTQIYNTLEKYGALDYTIIVSESASKPAIRQFLSAYTATAIAEFFLEQGKDVLVVYDDLSKHAVAYREVSLLLRRSPGREAYPGDVFYIHSRLLERAIKLNKKYGGGSITALPIIETQAGDVSAYIPTNVISITDGQIFLDSGLFNKGIIPALNVGISVSRVGSAAQTKIIKKLAGTLKLDLATYYELESFSQFSSELDDATLKILNRGQKVIRSFNQDKNTPYELWQEVVVMWAVTKGYLDPIENDQVVQKIKELLSISSTNKKLISDINSKKELTEEIESELNKLMKIFFK